MWINVKMYQNLWPSMASLPIISPACISTSAISAPAKETHPEAIFQSCYEKLLTIHALILYLNKIKRLALSFTTEAHEIHPSIP
jgi:hypothetical protein